MKKYLSYKQGKPQGDYDVIVIGSGLGGMATAATLAKAGVEKVLVLEKHYAIGGFTHVFKRKDYEWDVGVHYVGDMHSEKKLIPRFFNYLTEDRLSWADMGEVYDRIVFDDKTYDFVKGRKEFVESLKEQFPDKADHQAIDKYMGMILKVLISSKFFFAHKQLSGWTGRWIRKLTGRKFRKLAAKTTLEVLSNITTNKKLIGVLTGQYGDYGLPPAQSSFAMHAILVNHYINGGYFPVGGSAKIAESIYPAIASNGGEVYSNAEVSEILTDGKKVTGVKMADGHEIQSKVVVSNAGIFNTYQKLLDQNLPMLEKIKDQIDGLKPSIAHICLYIGLKDSAISLQLPKSNFWIYPGYDHDENVTKYLQNPDEEPFPVVYISFPSAKDPDWENRYPGKATIEIITLSPFEWFEKWEDTNWKKRGDEYEALKEKWSQKLLETLYKQLPQLKGKIDYHELSTPLSTKNFTDYSYGEIYGLEHSPERFQNEYLTPHTPIKGLFLTGQDIISCGVGGALASGLLTASSVLDKDLTKKFM